MKDIKLYNEEDDDDFKIYCLEGVEDIEDEKDSMLYPFLEHLALNTGITNVYQKCDSFEGFEESISTLLYEDRQFRDYQIIYLVFNGQNDTIELGGYYYTLEEIAELFAGRLTDKIIHFANTKQLDLEDDTFQYFLDVTGAKAVSGYVKHSPLLSTIFDQHYFEYAKHYDDEVELVEALYEKHYNLGMKMGFRLYY